MPIPSLWIVGRCMAYASSVVRPQVMPDFDEPQFVKLAGGMGNLCVCVWPQYCKLLYFNFVNLPLHFKQGAIPLVTGGWPTKRPVARAVNVPADSSWVLVCAAGMSKK